MEQYGSLYQHIEKVIKNLSKFKLFCYFFHLGLEWSIS